MIFDDLYSLIERCRPGILKCISEDAARFLKHCTDFEAIRFVLLPTCVKTFDSINGDLIDSAPVDSFVVQSIMYALEEVA